MPSKANKKAAAAARSASLLKKNGFKEENFMNTPTVPLTSSLMINEHNFPALTSAPTAAQPTAWGNRATKTKTDGKASNETVQEVVSAVASNVSCLPSSNSDLLCPFGLQINESLISTEEDSSLQIASSDFPHIIPQNDFPSLSTPSTSSTLPSSFYTEKATVIWTNTSAYTSQINKTVHEIVSITTPNSSDLPTFPSDLLVPSSADLQTNVSRFSVSSISPSSLTAACDVVGPSSSALEVSPIFNAEDDFPSLVSTPKVDVRKKTWVHASSRKVSTTSVSTPPKLTFETKPIAETPLPDLPSTSSSIAQLKRNRPVKVITNSFEMVIKSKKVFRYDVTIERCTDGYDKGIQISGTKGSDRHRQADCIEIIKATLARKGLEKVCIAYDGASTLFLTTRLEDITSRGRAVARYTLDSTELSKELKIRYFSEKSGRFEIHIQPNSRIPELNTKNLFDEGLENMESGGNVTKAMIQIASNQDARKAGFMVLEGNQLFDMRTEGNRQNDGSIERDGLGASINLQKEKKEMELRIWYLRVNKKSKFFNAGPLEKIGAKFENRKECERFLKNLRVTTCYSTQTFSIDGVTRESVGELKLPNCGSSILESSAKIARKKVGDYNRKWPAMQANLYNKDAKKKIGYWFPIENLIVLPDQKMGQQHGNPPVPAIPDKLFNATLRVGADSFLISENKTLNTFGVSVLPKPIEVDATTLSMPRIVYNNGQNTYPDLAKKASWEVKGKFVKPTQINMILILFNSADEKGNVLQLVQEFKKNLVEHSAVLGSKINRETIKIEDLGREYPGMTTEKALEIRMEILKAKTKAERPIVIYADHSACSSHGFLKLQERLCEVVTQHIALDQSMRRQLKTTIIYILMKLNVKNNGFNHKIKVDSSISRLWGDSSNTLIISYDVCHSSGKRLYRKDEVCNEPSVVGMPRKEEVDESILKMKVILMMKQYVTARKKYPSHVIILRDGVSEGQYKMVRNHEFRAIRQGVHDFLAANQEKTVPSFALIISTKRHANRLFVKNEIGVIDNVPALTAIDHTIVWKNGNEIIFVSHCPVKGTAQPIMLNTLYNDVFRSNEEIVNLVAALCCSHQCSNSIISLPETVFAADLYAKRGADIFEAYKQKCKADKIPLPKLESNQIDFETISLKLSYEKSDFFRNRRIV